MIAFLKAKSDRTIVADTGMSILFAQPDGLWESLYTCPGGEIPETDPIEDFENCSEEVGYLVDAWEDVDDAQLAQALEAVKQNQ